MTTQNVTPEEHVWSSLADITGDPLDHERSIPEEQIALLVQIFDAKRTLRAPTSKAPPGSLNVLVSGTHIVLKLNPLAINLAKAFCSAYGLLLISDYVVKIKAAADLADTLPKLKSCIAKLDPDAGQMCTYTAVIRAGSDLQRDIGMRPTVTQVTQAHTTLRSSCPQTSCRYFRNGGCGIKDSELDGVIATLHKDGILTKPSSDQLWVTL